MRHHSNIRKFGREKTQRHALLRSLARNLIRDSRIKTTTAKARIASVRREDGHHGPHEYRGFARLVNSRLMSPVETKKLFDVIAPKYAKRAGGYTRIIRLPNRDLDGSSMSLIEFV